MIKIAILSLHHGVNNRGAEAWIDTFKEKLANKFDIGVFRGVKQFMSWKNSDFVISIDGRFQVIVTRILTWLIRKPMIVFGHSGLGADDKWNLFCMPDVFVAFSTYQKKWAERFKFPWTKIVLIPHAVDLKKFTPAKRKPNKKIILCVAANTPNKRISLVEKAVRLIPGVTFLAVGKGNQIETSFDKMPDFYKKADVFCFVPQPWEAFGLVFLEALASNLPVVTINDPVRREIVGDAGILVGNPEDSGELVKAITTALGTNWGDNPRKQAEKFSWDKIRIKYIELFKNLL